MDGISHRPMIMGILNATPDSFSDGGRFLETSEAVAHVRRMLREGAAIIDIGGESTRPGADRVSVEEQLARTLEIIAECRREVPEKLDISIDTTRSQVAEQALDAGATMINDVTAGTDDPAILDLAAQRKAPICLMHIQGRPKNMQDNPQYEDVVEDVRRFLLEQVDKAVARGVGEDYIVLDPGIGFGKTREHNLRLLAGLPRLVAEGFPVLLGTSRKGFLEPHAVDGDRLPAACVTTVWGVRAGVRIFRVHDVREHRQAAEFAWEIARAGAA